MKKFFSFILIFSGVLIIGYSVWEIWETNKLQDQSLVEAKEIIRQNKDNPETPQDPNGFEAEKGESIGVLQIPALERELPIVFGVDEDDLKQGVGHYPGTVFPGQGSQIVLSGHRDTVFRQFGDLKIGDHFVVDMPYGTYEYAIKETEIVSADDLTVINPSAYDEEMLTVTTCYPFNFVGSAPDRYIIYATPVN